jgi:hypothetical protein
MGASTVPNATGQADSDARNDDLLHCSILAGRWRLSLTD